MGATSNLLRFERVYPSSLKADEPCSTYRAWSEFNNLAHLVDASAQHRINHQIAYDGSADEVAHPLDTYWEQQFTHSWLKPILPANLDILIAIRVAAAEGYSLHMHAEIVPVSHSSSPPALWGIDLDLDAGDYIGTETDVIDERVYFDISTTGVWSEIDATIPIIDAGGISAFPIFFMSKLRVIFTSSDADSSQRADGVQLCRVLVREFA